MLFSSMAMKNKAHTGSSGSWLKNSILIALASAVAVQCVSIYLNRSDGDIVQYTGKGWMREGFQWDEKNRRFLVSMFEGGIAQVQGFKNKEEVVVVLDEQYKGNSTLGIRVDPARNRLLAVVADPVGRKYSALAAYDLTTWETTFVTELESPAGDLRFADDVAVDPEGNSYVTDAQNNLIWRVNADGSKVSVISSPVFISKPNRLPFNMAGLNGIDCHPDGFLLVIHTWSGALFKVSPDGSKVSPDGSKVKAVDVAPLTGGDGIALLTPDKLVVAGIPGAKIVETTDGWETAKITDSYIGPFYRLPTAAAIKDGKAYINFAWGLSGWKGFTLKEVPFFK